MGVSTFSEKQRKGEKMYRKRFAEKSTVRRLALRIMVSIIGIAIALYYFSKVINAPVFPYPQQQWANVAYLILVAMGAILFYWASFTDFDRSRDEKFFG
jgi:protein-S-isoprenylcysteine O-methyltransferase Ste14